jgi:5,10-methylene-tetrahydrofolate dehydrogenase/methenyl tetrahydrofolate cyclohydrolase
MVNTKMKKNNKKISQTKKKTKSFKKEIKEADIALRKAKKEILEAEEATNKAREEVVDVAIISKGIKKKRLGDAARDLEKATHLAAESCESTEEAEIKFKEYQKRV